MEYQKVRELSAIEISVILHSEASRSAEKTSALFSAAYYHSEEVFADAILHVINSKDVELIDYALEALLAFLEMRKSQHRRDEILSALKPLAVHSKSFEERVKEVSVAYSYL